MSQRSLDLLCTVDGDLLEGPVWDDRDGSLLFVDMRRPALHQLAWDTRALRTFGRGTAASAIVPAARSGLVVAERTEVTLGTTVPAVRAGTFAIGEPDVRFNDAACDGAGRLWIGTMADDARPDAGQLLRLDPDLTWTVVLEDVTISNGIGWSPDHRSMYFIDSATRRIDVLDYDIDTGAAVRRRQLVDTSHHPGMPDGLTVDADGCLWVAFYGGSGIRRFAPDGRLLEEVAAPVPRTTSLCFAGPDLDVLVVTVRGDDRRADGRPTGAHLYAHTPTTRGLPTTAFGG